MVKEDVIRKGEAAKALLDNQDFRIAMETVRIQAFKGFADSEPGQQNTREENYHLLRAISQLKLNLELLAETAKWELEKEDRNAKTPEPVKPQTLFGEDDE